MRLVATRDTPVGASIALHVKAVAVVSHRSYTLLQGPLPERNHARLQTKSLSKLMVVMAIGVTSHNLDWIGSLNRGPQTSFRDKETIDEEKP
jgi:hypothetical protein